MIGEVKRQGGVLGGEVCHDGRLGPFPRGMIAVSLSSSLTFLVSDAQAVGLCRVVNPFLYLIFARVKLYLALEGEKIDYRSGTSGRSGARREDGGMEGKD